MQRKRVYEIVLREGRADDIRRYIDLAELRRVWDDLYLPENVRAAWADYFRLGSGEWQPPSGGGD